MVREIISTGRTRGERSLPGRNSDTEDICTAILCQPKRTATHTAACVQYALARLDTRPPGQDAVHMGLGLEVVACVCFPVANVCGQHLPVGPEVGYHP